MKPRGWHISRPLLLSLALAALTSPTFTPARAAEVLKPNEIFDIKRAVEAEISPDGEMIAYVIRVPRRADDDAGADYRELHVVATETGSSRPYVTGKVSVSAVRWSPDGNRIAYLTSRGKKGAKRQVWVIPVDGGESFQVTRSKTNVVGYRWHPDGEHVAYIAQSPPTSKEKKLKEKGYGFIYYEENLKARQLHMVAVESEAEDAEPRTLVDGNSVWSFEFGPDGKMIAFGTSPHALIDERYVSQRIDLLNIDTGEIETVIEQRGKLGNFAFSPDGKRLVYAGARDENDHAVSQAYVVDLANHERTNLTPKEFRGHIRWVGWRDKNTILFLAGEGVWPTLNVVRAGGGSHRVILHSDEEGVVFSTPSYTENFKDFAMVGTSPTIPGDIYHWTPGQKMKRLTTLNPWLAEKALGEVEVISYPARDGLEIQGLLYYPVGYEPGRRYPLIVVVHGGPESHYSNGWNTFYSRPVQVLSGKGYAVFMPNYRSSTGYGVDYTSDHLGDPAGKEFDDIADGIDYLVERGVADGDRVGLGGGSYGGYAAAWFSSYYTKYVRAVCMFVGISDLISKRGTTDIPYEELLVHSGKKLEEMWKLSLERSPIYWAHQSRTAVLIIGGAADTRVHPSQSLEYYRRLKMNDHPSVRLVQYPGEGHGNSKHPGRRDVLHRTLQWYDWYVMDAKSLDGPMPPLDISDSYGLKMEEKKKEKEKEKEELDS